MTQHYPLQSSERERRRLKMQSQALIPMSLRLLDGAGVGPGSRVLELGCGNGELTKLIAQRVGPSGQVVAIDRDPAQIDAAGQTLHAEGLGNVVLQVAEAEAFSPDRPFDAVIARYFLLYATDPEAMVAKAATWLRPAGAMGFLEMDFYRGVGSRIWPLPLPETERAIGFIADAMLDAGVQPHLSARLPSLLSRYGEVEAELAAPLQMGAESVELPLEAVRSVQATARRIGRADHADHDVDRLLQAELSRRDRHTVTIPPLSVAAWVRLRSGSRPATLA